MSDPCDCFGCEEEGPSLPAYESTPELALAALLSLMTSFPTRRSPAVARSVIAHLRVVSGDPRLDGLLRDCAAQLVGHWQALELLALPVGGPLTVVAPPGAN